MLYSILIVDFIPVITFFSIYMLYDIFYASFFLVCTYIFVIIYHYICYRKLKLSKIITFFFIFIFNLLTLFYHNTVFIKLKVTIFYMVCSLFLLINQFIFNRKLFIKKFFNNTIIVSEKVWKKINLAWSIFFIFCGIINTYITFFLSEKIWIYFKIFGYTILTIIFTLLTIFYINVFEKDIISKK